MVPGLPYFFGKDWALKDFQDSFGRQMSGILRASKGETR
jgi:hypothetical protein